ncbi:MAG: hypothetical protein P8X59_02165 [Woeseiaceae bacterium]|jgi:hypothetical protein
MPLTIAAIAIAVAGCETEFERRIAAAERQRAEAAAAGAEWLQTGKLLEQARQEAEQDNVDAALELVDKAKFQAEMALQQALREEEAWVRRVVR